jgi:sugar/nucleoside kinase (ribokinase family)
MAKILVSGLINLENTLRIDDFPLEYSPVNYPFWGVRSSISGVGYNVAKALTTLGDSVNFLSIIGTDFIGDMILHSLARDQLDPRYIARCVEETAQSVIIYDKIGRRQIHVDLKNLQGTPYPLPEFSTALTDCDLAVLCNINFSRPFLQPAKQAGKLIATDVHEIHDLQDPYNLDFMAAADILFMSGSGLPATPLNWIQAVRRRFGNEIIVIGLGENGALLSVCSDDAIEHVPAVRTRPVVNTIGAGDALFSAFVHFYAQERDPHTALKKATLFASYKIGERGAAEGFLHEDALLTLARQLGY